jgi:hypothetical protein
MTWGIVATVGGSLIGGMMASDSQEDAANTAANAQTASSEAAIAEQRRQFDAVRQLLQPYSDQGRQAVQDLQPFQQGGAQAQMQQRVLAGLMGPDAQKALIDQIGASPTMQAYTQQGENAILANASATGGLRGGNTQAALAQFRPRLLAQLIDQQYSRLGGISDVARTTTQNIAQLGQASAAGQATAGLNTATNIGNLLTQQGQAQAGAALAAGQGQANMWSGLGSTASTLGTLQMLGKFPDQTSGAQLGTGGIVASGDMYPGF